MTDLNKDLERLALKELLKIFRESSGKIKDKIKRVIIEKVLSQKKLITLESTHKEDILQIYKITQNSSYKRMEDCLGSHWSMNLIGLGLYVAELNKEQQRELQERVRIEVHKKYGSKGLRILEMGSTGTIDNVINYLSSVKIRKNYNIIQMGRLFDKVIEKWNEITIFVKSENNTNTIELKCLDMLEKKIPLFFVFAYGSAVPNTISVLAKLNVNNDFRGYIFEAKMENSCNPYQKECYTCSFENVEGFGIDMFS